MSQLYFLFVSVDRFIF